MRARLLPLPCCTTNRSLSGNDAGFTREVFWDLFRQSIITLGCDNADQNYPFFALSHFGKDLANQNVYFFHDLKSYTKLIQSNVPNIPTTSRCSTFKRRCGRLKTGCMLAATVMLGVASEHSFLLLVEAAEQSPKYRCHFGTVAKK